MVTTTEQTDIPAPLWPSLLAVASVASLPYLALVASNVGEGLDSGTVATWWLITLGVSLAVVAGVGRTRRSAARWAGVVVAVTVYLFFNAPLVGSVGAGLDLPLTEVGWWAIASGVVLVPTMLAARLGPVQRFVEVVAPLLLLGPVLQLVAAPPVDAVAGPVDAEVTQLARTPNVYWFVFDGLASASFLHDELGVDTEPLVTALERDGFDVLTDSSSNYPLTHVAVASALEMELLHDGPDEPPAGPYFAAIRGENRVVDTFLANGYDYVHAYPGVWSGSRCGGREDVCLGRHGTLTDTELALLAATPLLDLVVDTEAHSTVAEVNDPVAVVDKILASPAQDPTYAFVHVLNPHPPYLRDGDCRLQEVPLTFSAWGAGDEYRDATSCLLTRLEATVDRILAVDDDPVIILSGDHGPRLGLGPETEGTVLLGDEMYLSAFSAIRLPTACQELDVPDGMTLVNTFRLVFACLTDTDPTFVEDRVIPLNRDYD